MAFNGTIFKKKIPKDVEFFIEGNCWALNCAIFSYLSGDLHHGSAQYLIEGVRMALTKYSYEHKFKYFNDKIFGYLLNNELLSLGFTIRRGKNNKNFMNVEKELLDYLPPIKKEFIKKEYDEKFKIEFIEIPYSFKKLGSLYFVVNFLTEVNDVMSRVEADPIGTFMFDTLKKFKKYLYDKFQSLTPNSLVDYQVVFNTFLNQKENFAIKKQLIEYQKAKIISNFDVETMLDIGENELIEFKEDVTNTIIHDIIAFSNTFGGKILVGISDDKKVKGIKHVDKTIDHLSNLIMGNCNPKINPFIVPQKIHRKNIIVVEVLPSKEIITDNENNCYIRKTKQNRKPSPTEYEELIITKKNILLSNG